MTLEIGPSKCILPAVNCERRHTSYKARVSLPTESCARCHSNPSDNPSDTYNCQNEVLNRDISGSRCLCECSRAGHKPPYMVSTLVSLFFYWLLTEIMQRSWKLYGKGDWRLKMQFPWYVVRIRYFAS
jgi:hypothetical protein